MSTASVSRIISDYTPFTSSDPQKKWHKRGQWPAYWLKWPEGSPNAAIYQLEFTITEKTIIRLHVSGDNKYHLKLNGERIGIGPELGDLNNYYFETYDLSLEPGEHSLSALVFDFKDAAPFCQMSLKPGFLAAAENVPQELFNTGYAAWEVTPVDGWSWQQCLSIYPSTELFAAKLMQAPEWQPAQRDIKAASAGIRNEYCNERLLRPASLPERLFDKQSMIETLWVFNDPGPQVFCDNKLNEEDHWLNALCGHAPITVAPHSCRRIIGRLNDYHCVFPKLHTTGGSGSEITLRWAEGLFSEYDENSSKGKRNKINHKYFLGYGETFHPAEGENCFFTPWWRSGRYFELIITTGDDPIAIMELELFDTRYPYDSELELDTSNEQLNRVLPLSLRTFQMCTHDTFMDCPYYEQLMYIGDSRLESLIMMISTSDKRMNEKMLRMFAASAAPDGLLASRYPSRLRQVIPTFSPLWIASLHDYAMFRNDYKTVKELIGTARHIIDAFEQRVNSSGLIEFRQGWNFVDWTPDWCKDGRMGIPPDGEYGVSAVVNLLFIYSLRHMAELCEYLNEPHNATHYRKMQKTLMDNVIKYFWNQERGLFADDLAGKHYSEHSQCLALLSGALPEELAKQAEKALFYAEGLADCSIYFSHYYFECCHLLNNPDAFFQRLQLWFDCDNLGLKTLLERPEPSRSDCHAWSSHPYFHVPATLAGIRPADFEFRRVSIKPMPGQLTSLHAEMIHPAGKITADYKTVNGVRHAKITLPKGIEGEIILPEEVKQLQAGTNQLTW